MKEIKSMDPIAHFMSKVKIVDGHWLWQAGLTQMTKGYGMVYLGRNEEGKKIFELAHRRAYALFIEPIPEGAWILHKKECGIMQCCCPMHIYPGNPKQNSEDCFKFGGRGRSNLTDADILAIRSGNRPRKELAIEYGLSYHSIMRIQNGRTWKGV
jgi:hypothetical protein